MSFWVFVQIRLQKQENLKSSHIIAKLIQGQPPIFNPIKIYCVDNIQIETSYYGVIHVWPTEVYYVLCQNIRQIYSQKYWLHMDNQVPRNNKINYTVVGETSKPISWRHVHGFWFSWDLSSTCLHGHDGRERAYEQTRTKALAVIVWMNHQDFYQFFPCFFKIKSNVLLLIIFLQRLTNYQH